MSTTRLFLITLLLVLPTLAQAEDGEASDDSAPSDDPVPSDDPAPVPPPVVPVPPPVALPPPQVGFDKGFFIASPDDAFRLVLGGRVQFRFVYENVAGEPRGNEAHFELPRMRFKMGGHLFDKRIEYKAQIDFAKGQVSLKDAFLDIVGNEWLILRMGQFKTPYSRQFIASSTKQHFVDRSITHKAFAPDRDVGILLTSDWKKAPLEYAIGVFNGTGDAGAFSGTVLVDPTTGEGDLLSAHSSNVPDVPHPMIVTRVGWHTQGFDGYDESDLGNSDFGVGLGGGLYVDLDADGGDDSAIGWQGDVSLKVRGFSTTAAVYAVMEQSGAEFTDQALNSVGFHASVAYAIKSRVEPALGYGRITPTDASGDTQEILGGVNVYFFKHNIKWVTDAAALIDGADADFRLRTQFQLDF